ncbi:MAG: nicotianamine synthase family protein [Euryarchaeota archaeon]|jgi:precorrin-6B methylase 2|nr:nicotianamine synthase family protein [Euryarchaeota archaeon]
MEQHAKPNTILDSIAIFFIKKTANCFWEVADTWSYKNDAITRIYNKTIGKEYQKEYEDCGISSHSNILHIGCGSYPLTEIVLANCTKGQIVGIDKNNKAVQRGQQVIKKNNLDKRIILKHGDGLDFPVEEFDMVIVSSCSQPKEKILQHLFQKVRPQGTIIVREVDIATKDILNYIAAHPDIELKQQIRHNPFPFFEPIGWTTFCLTKK